MAAIKKLFIFDLDGTIADTVESLAYSVNQCLRAAGLPEHPMDKYKYFAGEGAAVMLKRSLAAAGDTGLTHFEEAMEHYRNIFAQGCLYRVKPYDGMPQALQSLKDRGMKLAVLTNKADENAHPLVEQIYGKGFFDLILGQNDTHKRKPSPEGVYLIQNHFRADARECVYVGDTSTDMETGKAAGLYTVGVTWGFRDRQELEAAHADQIITHPSQLLTLPGLEDSFYSPL